ncbi:BlaI/MecI/CopY family transcriptional regulator [Acetobacteraceae bacterium KSS8]|uniref:BlaI/MecI/CopY family transcriptional regulator n=1 Tax=Endosaccharibacter trunci TaxID=2812733 RepID=A0ABT1W7B7_9PROT|nr:BlaI/MecI/CopY family transcriptional regulator [Acetobacteraceae bacterium KSS8]
MRRPTHDANPGSTELGELEREIMDLVWRLAPVTAERLRSELPREPKESTVRTVLRRLEAKGLVSHTLDGRTFLYRARAPRRAVAARAVGRIMDWFRIGSVSEMLVGMAEAGMLDHKDLEQLIARLDAADREPKP